MSPTTAPRDLDDLAREFYAPCLADPFDESAWAGRTQLTRELADAILSAGPGDENGRTRVGGLQIATAGWSPARGAHAYSVADPAVDPQAWIAALGRPDDAVLTSDGQGVITSGADAWCRHVDGGDVPIGEWVRYERWSEAGVEAHGFVHSACRRLLQTG
jgi:hypothetical protein